MTPKDMQRLSVKSQIKKYGGKEKYREEMKKRSAMGVEAKKKFSTDTSLRKVEKVL